MHEKKGIRVKTWPVAANERGIWGLSGDLPWITPGEVPHDGLIHYDAELLMKHMGVSDQMDLLHMTSVADSLGSAYWHYLAVINVQGVRMHTRWPGCRLLNLDVWDAAGQPESHGPVDPPNPTNLDIVRHGLGVLRDLRDKNNVAGAPLREGPWMAHLDAIEPELVKMYQYSL